MPNIFANFLILLDFPVEPSYACSRRLLRLYRPCVSNTCLTAAVPIRINSSFVNVLTSTVSSNCFDAMQILQIRWKRVGRDQKRVCENRRPEEISACEVRWRRALPENREPNRLGTATIQTSKKLQAVTTLGRAEKEIEEYATARGRNNHELKPKPKR